MNNLNDISTDKAYATICGYTKQEMEKYFNSSIEQLAGKEGASKEETYNKISIGTMVIPSQKGYTTLFLYCLCLLKKGFKAIGFKQQHLLFLSSV